MRVVPSPSPLSKSHDRAATTPPNKDIVSHRQGDSGKDGLGKKGIGTCAMRGARDGDGSGGNETVALVLP